MSLICCLSLYRVAVNSDSLILSPGSLQPHLLDFFPVSVLSLHMKTPVAPVGFEDQVTLFLGLSPFGSSFVIFGFDGH